MKRAKIILPLAAVALAALFLLWGRDGGGRAAGGRGGDGVTRLPEEERGPAVELDVFVRSMPADVPLAGARVRLGGVVGRSRAILSIDETSETGAAKVVHHGEPVLMLEVHAPGHVGKTVDVLSGQRRFEFALESFASAEGRVLTPRGEPVEASLTLQLPVGAGAGELMLQDVLGSSSLGANADADGRFRFDGLPPGKHYQLSVRADGFALAERSFSLAAGEQKQLAFTLKSGGGVKGRILGVNDEVLVDAEVRLYRRKGRGWMQSSGTRTDEAGRFLFTQIQPGIRLLQAEHASGANRVFVSRQVEVPDGRVADLGDLKPDGGTLTINFVTKAQLKEGESRTVLLFVFLIPKGGGAAVPFGSIGGYAKLGESITVAGLPPGHYQVGMGPTSQSLQSKAVEFDWEAGTNHREVEIVAWRKPPAARLEVYLRRSSAPRMVLARADGRILGRYDAAAGDLRPVVFRDLSLDAKGEIWILETGHFAIVPMPRLASVTKVEVADDAYRRSALVGGKVRGFNGSTEVFLAFPGNDFPLMRMLAKRTPDAKGRFRFSDVPPDVDLELVVFHEGQVWPGVLLRTPKPGESDETFVLER